MKTFDPSSYVESGHTEDPATDSHNADYAVNRNGASQPSGGHIADGGTYGGLATR